MLTFYAKVTPKTEHYEAVKKLIMDITPLIREEEGCQIYNVHEFVEADGSKILFLYEIFDSQAAYDWHMQQDFAKKAIEALMPLIAKPVEVNRLELIQ